LGCYYLRRRYYVHWLGRFLSKDPLRQGGENAYGYVNNRPTTATDASGLRSSAEHCAKLAQRLRGLSSPLYPWNCQVLNDLLYEYLHDCLELSPPPGLPPGTPWVPPVAPPGYPGLGDVPGYNAWRCRCHQTPPAQPPPEPRRPPRPRKPPRKWRPRRPADPDKDPCETSYASKTGEDNLGLIQCKCQWDCPQSGGFWETDPIVSCGQAEATDCESCCDYWAPPDGEPPSIWPR